MNAYEISSKRFDKSAFGYKADEVEEFLREIAAYIEKLEAEKKEIENKLVILGDKVKEYRKDEESLRDALLSAQKVATSVTSDAREKAARIEAEATEKSDAVLSEAEAKAKKILSDAEAKAKEILGDTAEKTEQEKEVFIRMKKEVSDFKQDLLNIYKSHLDLITKLPEIVREEMEEKAPAEEPAEPVEESFASEPVEEAAQEPQAMPEDPAATQQIQPETKESTRQAVEDFTRQQEKEQEKGKPNFQIKLTEKKDDPLASASSKFESRFQDLKFGKHSDQ